jgi:hypothetical protein
MAEGLKDENGTELAQEPFKVGADYASDDESGSKTDLSVEDEV